MIYDFFTKTQLCAGILGSSFLNEYLSLSGSRVLMLTSGTSMAESEFWRIERRSDEIVVISDKKSFVQGIFLLAFFGIGLFLLLRSSLPFMFIGALTLGYWLFVFVWSAGVVYAVYGLLPAHLITTFDLKVRAVEQQQSDWGGLRVRKKIIPLDDVEGVGLLKWQGESAVWYEPVLTLADEKHLSLAISPDDERDFIFLVGSLSRSLSIPTINREVQASFLGWSRTVRAREA